MARIGELAHAVGRGIGFSMYYVMVLTNKLLSHKTSV